MAINDPNIMCESTQNPKIIKSPYDHPLSVMINRCMMECPEEVKNKAQKLSIGRYSFIITTNSEVWYARNIGNNRIQYIKDTNNIYLLELFIYDYYEIYL